MKKIVFLLSAICITSVIVLGLFALPLMSSDTDRLAERHFEKAIGHIRQSMYDDAITELEQVITLVPASKIAHDAQYWIGQSYYKAGKYDDALSTFEKLTEEYPESEITPVALLMVGRVRLAKANVKLRNTTSDASDKGFIVDPETGVKYIRIKTFAGKRDFEDHYGLNLSPNGRFLLNGNLVVPLDSGDPFDLVNMAATRGTWSLDGKKAAFYAEGAIWMVPVSPETGRPTGPPKKLLDGNYRWDVNPGWSPDGEKLVFRREDDEISGDIWTISVKDGALTQITDDPLSEYGPVWSPDGETIAYGKDRPSIWLVPAEGGTAGKIIESGTRCFPSWSPDGKWIIYGNVHLFRIADKQKLEIISPREVGSFFSWSPDGKKMLFYRGSYEYKEALKVVSASGGPHLELGRQLTFWGGALWSPDSKMITVEGENEDGDIVFWIVPLSGTDPFLLEMDVSVDGKPFPFAVSPDVKKLAFSVERDDGLQDLFVVPISLKDARTTGPAIKVFDGWYRSGGYNVKFSWSSDGNKIAVIHKEDLWIASSNGDKPVQLTKTPEKECWPGWSPDGRMISYALPTGKDKGVLCVISSEGKMIKKLDDCKAITWSPDSKELAVAFKNAQLSVLSIAGGKTRRIAELKDLGLERISGLCWSPDGRNIACVGYHIEKDRPSPIFIIPMAGGKATKIATDDNSLKYWLKWSPDSKWIAYSSDESVKIRPEGIMWEADFEEILAKLSD